MTLAPEELSERFVLLPTNKDVMLRHDRQLWQARFSPCGRLLVACGYDATIQRWDVSSDEPKLMTPLTGHHGWVQVMDFQPSRKHLLTADSWGQLACWPYDGEAPVPIWRREQAHPGWIRALAVSPDGELVATGGNGSVVRMWSTETGELRQELTHDYRVFSLCFHPDGKSLVTGDLEGVIRHWRLADGVEVRRFDASTLYADESKTKDRIQQCGGARHLKFDAAGKLLACAGQMNPGGGFATGIPCVLVFDWEGVERDGVVSAAREMPMGDTQDGFAYDAQFHPEGFVMATSSAFPGKGHVWFWRPEDDQAFFSSNKLSNGRSLSLHPDGQRVAFLSSQSPNGNGRSLKDGEYAGGTAVLRLMRFPGAV